MTAPELALPLRQKTAATVLQCPASVETVSPSDFNTGQAEV